MYLIHLLLACYAPLIHAEVSSKTSPSVATAATCPYRTVNYITHSLPQQCLTASRNTTIHRNTTIPEHADIQTSHVPTTYAASIDQTSTHSDRERATVTSSAEGAGEIVGSISSAHQPSQTETPDIIEEDSPLESDNFLSFEEWKKQSLLKAGQSVHVGKPSQPEVHEGRSRLAQVQSPLDSLGDDGEIDIDFSGFVPDGPQRSVRQEIEPSDNIPEADVESPPAIRSGSKDAGTTCKERFNYASFDCAANVLKTNPAAKSPLSVLSENKDAYMLNKCSADNKFLILELCDDISIDTVVLANFEFFSSTFRTFRVSVSDRYPVKTEKWKTIGTYEARNSREVQAFLVENPVIWARYLRIEFLTHYGNEFYCPLSLVRVHGTTMLEEFKRMNDDINEEDEERTSDELSAAADSVPETVAALLEHPGNSETSTVYDSEAQDIMDLDDGQHSETNLTQLVEVSAPVSALQDVISAAVISNTCLPEEEPTITSSNISERIESSTQPMNLSVTYIDAIHTANASQTQITSSTKDKKESDASIVSPNKARADGATESQIQSRSKASSASSKPSEMDKQKSASHPPERNLNATTTSDRQKAASSANSASPAAPTMQESFFKSVQKRLQMLESNSSLSLQYIEDQSRALRDAFKKVEQRQLVKTTSFLEHLNTTVLSELRDFRQQYDQLWQSTVIELEMQRERYEKDNAAINARLGILADEIIFQRRLGILQMILIVVCLTLVLFSRGTIHNYLELPLVQNVLSRSPSSRWLNLSGIDSPSQTPQMSRIRSAQELRSRQGILKGHQRMKSEDSNADTLSPSEQYAPPTPVSFTALDDTSPSPNDLKATSFDSEAEETVFSDPDFDPGSIERPSTSPPTVSSGRLTPTDDNFSHHSHSMSMDTMLSSSSPNVDYQALPPRLIVEEFPPSKRLTWDIPDLTETLMTHDD